MFRTYQAVPEANASRSSRTEPPADATAWQAALRRDGDVEIFGECVRAGRRANVRISSLDCDGCDVSAELPPGCEIALWIGAIGPFVADAVQNQAGHVCVRFKEPIDRRIVDHFEVA